MITVCIILLIVYLVNKSKYEKSEYVAQTHNSYSSVRFDKGKYGEYLSYKLLSKYEEDGAKFLFNCYLPKENGETTEVDLMMIHYSGIFVFESKNYSGWIFGSEYQKNWTQTLPSGRRAQKEHFLNPVIQNKIHINNLIRQIGTNMPIHSIIVFSDRCAFKDVKVDSDNIYVIHRYQLVKQVQDIILRKGVCLSKAEIDDIYQQLYGFTQVSDLVKLQHVENIRNSVNVDSFSESQAGMCPRCGGTLVLRTAQRGVYAGNQFYGCSNYPKCKYTKDI